MKTIPFSINGSTGQVQVVVHEQVVPTLKRMGLLKDECTLLVDWGNCGFFAEVFVTPQHITCPWCSASNSLAVEDLGFEEFECRGCESTFTVPATLAEVKAMNAQVRSNVAAHKSAFYRVMLTGEDGGLSCLRNGVTADLIEVVVAGYQTFYTEGQNVFSEPEETLADLRRMCDQDDDY
jgi:hypothetical protein